MRKESSYRYLVSSWIRHLLTYLSLSKPLFKNAVQASPEKVKYPELRVLVSRTRTSSLLAATSTQFEAVPFWVLLDFRQFDGNCSVTKLLQLLNPRLNQVPGGVRR